MNFKLVHIFGFFFIAVKSRSVLDAEAYPLSPPPDSWFDFNKSGASSNPDNNAGGTEAPKDSAIDKIFQFGNKLKPNGNTWSGLENKFPNLFKTEDDPDFGLNKLYEEEGHETPKKNALVDGFKDKWQQTKDAVGNAKPGEKLQQVKDAIKWPWGKKNQDSESPDTGSSPQDYEDPKKNPFVDGVKDKWQQTKDAFGNVKPGEKYQQVKDAIKWPWGKTNENSESPDTGSSPQDYVDPKKNPFVDGVKDRWQQTKDAFGNVKPGEKLQQVKDAIKWPWNKKNQDSESPAAGSDHQEGETPEKKPMFGNAGEKLKDAWNGFNPGEKYQQAKDAVSGFNPGEKYQQAKDAVSGFKPGEKYQQAKDAVSGFKPGEKYQQAKDAISGFNPGEKFQQAKGKIWPFGRPWDKKPEDSESPEGGEHHENEPEPEPEQELHPQRTWPKLDWNPFKSRASQSEPEDTPKDHYPLHFIKNPFGENHDDATHDNEPHSDATPEDEHEPRKEEYPHREWPKFNWNPFKSRASEGEPKDAAENNHSPLKLPHFSNPFKNPFAKEHDDKDHGEEPHEETPEEILDEELEKVQDEAHHQEQPSHDWKDWNPWKHENSEPHKPNKEHGHGDDHHENSPGEKENPDHQGSHSPSKHSKHDDDEEPSSGSIIPDWFFGTKHPEREAKHHDPLNQETYYDVRAIGDSYGKSRPVKNQGDDDDEEEDDDDDDDDENDGNETDDYNTDDDNDIGNKKEKPSRYVDPDEEALFGDLKDKEKNGSKPRRRDDEEADDEDEDDDDEDEDDDDDDDDDDLENGAYLDKSTANFSIWNLVLPMVAKNLPSLPSIPNPFSMMNRMTVSFASINDLQKDPEILQKSLIKKVNQKYNEKNENVAPGTTISFWPPSITRG